jgi:hypothetical protein
MNIDWQRYGLRLKGGFMDDEGNAVLEWENVTFARVDIAIHTYSEGYPASILCNLYSFLTTIYGRLRIFLAFLALATAVQERQGSQQDKNLLRKALKSALSHLKADYAGDFLSCHGQRVRLLHICINIEIMF